MASLEQKREAFRKYLEGAGAIDCLSKALIKLYQQEQKPEDACKFIRHIMCETCPTDEQVTEMTKDLADSKKEICYLKKEIMSLKGEVRRSSSEVALALTSGYEKLKQDETCKSLLKKHLTEEVFNELKEKKTALKSTLLDCVQSGLENLDSGVGLYAADAECYELFGSLFNKVINEYHVDFGDDKKHPASDWGDATTFENLDPEGEFIVSTRVRCGRSIEGFPFNPRMKMEHYEQIMERAKTVLEGLQDDLKGVFHPLEGMTKELQQQLIDDHYLFKEGDKFLQTANACRFWPVGRAIFLNEPKTFLVWVNEEDHLRIISMDKGGDLGAIYQRLKTAVETIGKDMAFIRNERLGFLTFCPSNLGTTIRASVHIKLPKLGKVREKLDEAAAKYKLQVRGTRGEHTESEKGVFDISNKRRLGLTEYEAVKEMYDGIKELIELEKNTEDVPEEVKPAEASPSETKPAESKPAETKSSESTPKK